MSKRVLVVGDVMTDIIVRPEGPVVIGSDRRAAIETRPGGSGANQAVWLGAAGVEVAFAARVGLMDKASQEGRFRLCGVTPYLSGDEDLQSGMLVTLVDPSGERSFLTDRGANLNLCAEDLPDSLLDNTGLVLVSGYSFFAPGPRAAVQSLLSRARRRGTPVAVDPASIGFLEEVGPAVFLDWVGKADWIFANADEAAMLTGQQELEAQMVALGQQFDTVVIKLGRNGAALGGASGISVQLPVRVVEVVDSTGAGDAFAAGFIARLMDGEDVATCLGHGIENGARAVQFVGGQPR